MSNVDVMNLWEPDDGISNCNLCHRKFSLFFRRHHCRKCGKVVCGNCSDNYIKYFPNTPIANPEGVKRSSIRNELYRSCDVCTEEIGMIRQALFETGTQLNSNEEDISNREATLEQSNAGEEGDNTKYSTAVSVQMVNSSSTSLTSDAHGQRRNTSRDNISDADLCPVCAANLVKEYLKSARIDRISDGDDFERYKETHINDCLVAFDFSLDHQGSGSSPENIKTRSQNRNKMLVYNIPPIPKPKFETIPDPAGGSYDTISTQIQDSCSPPIPSVTSGNSIFTITEKPSISKSFDNECVICLEDIRPGDKVGRLECLCVYHYKCIKNWFSKKGYGECPVHSLHK